MSIRLMTVVWDVRFPTQSQLLIALKLADHANDDGGSIYPSRGRVAELTQSSPSTVKNVLRAFRAVGLLHVTKEGGYGAGATTHYKFNLRLLRSLATGEAELRGSSDELHIEWLDGGAKFDPLDMGSIMGSTVDPLPELRGQPSVTRGQMECDKGSKLLTPNLHLNHQLETSLSRAGACEAGASPTRSKATGLRRALLVQLGDPSWDEWLAVLPPAVSAAAAKAGAIEANDRWPRDDLDVKIVESKK